MKKTCIISSFFSACILFAIACGSSTDKKTTPPEEPIEQTERQTAMSDDTKQEGLADRDIQPEEETVSSPETEQPDETPVKKQEATTPVKSKAQNGSPGTSTGSKSADTKPTVTTTKEPVTTKPVESPVKTPPTTETSNETETGTAKTKEPVNEKTTAEEPPQKKDEPAVVAPPKKEEPKPAPPTPQQQPSTAGNWPVPASYNSKKNPEKADNNSIKIGKSLWAKHCKSCHGTDGLGDGPKAAQLDTPSGDFSTPAFQNQTDGALFYKTIEGRDDMPGYKKKIPYEEDIWHLVNFMRTFGN